MSTTVPRSHDAPAPRPVSDDAFAGCYVVPTETWDAAKCAAMARRVARDGMGTRYPFRGAVPELPTTQLFNGGCIVGDEWYTGRRYTRPILAAGFRWVQVPSWGWRIVADRDPAV